MTAQTHFIELLVANAPGWVGMAILAWIFVQYIRAEHDDDDDEK